MRTLVSIVFSAVMISCLAPAAQATSHQPMTKIAPADEYFGRQKMSILEIGNRLNDLAFRSRYPRANFDDAMHAASMTKDAMSDWQRKYPGDPWLRKDYAMLTRLYKAWGRR
jgi:hypothetical protein